MNNEMFKKEKIMMTISAAISGLFVIIMLIDEEINFLTLMASAQMIIALYTIYSVKDVKTINRNIIICIILSCLHFNIPSVLLLVWTKESMEHTLYQMNAPPMKQDNKKKIEPKKMFEQEKISDEARKIDILLKIGVFLVVLSGILFSTSSTGPIIDLFKPFFILLLSGIFYGLSYIFKTKVKIKKSENTYYILSNLFIVFFAIALAYFKTFGEFLSFDGEGAQIVMSFISLLSAVITRNLGNKYQKEGLKITSYMIVYLALAYALSYFDASNMLIISILLILSIVGNAKIDKNNTSYHSSKIILVMLLGVFVILYNMSSISNRENLFNGLLSAGLLIANLYFLSQEEKTVGYKRLYAYTTFFLINTSIINLLYILFPATYESETLANAYIYTSIFSLGAHHYFNKIEDLKYGGFIITSLLLAFSMFMTFVSECYIISLIISTILLVYSVWNIYKNSDENLQKVYFILQLLLIIAVIVSGVAILDVHFGINISIATAMLTYLCIAALIDIIEDEYITKIKLDLFLYYSIISSLSALSVILMFSNSIVFNLIVLAILIAYRLYVNKYIKNNDIMNCVIILTILFHLEYALGQLIPTLAHALIFVIFLLIAFFTRKEKVTSVFALGLAYFPYLMMIEKLALPDDYLTILMATPAFVLISVTCNTLLDMPVKTKNIIETIALMFIMLTLIFEVSLVIGLFIATISLVMIFVGTRDTKYNALFYTGIISLILNIIIQLQEFWSKIPWFIYTLIAGLIIIFYVTYKELNKDKKTNLKDTKVIYYEEKQYETRRNVVTLILFISYLVSIGIYGGIKYEVDNIIEDQK